MGQHLVIFGVVGRLLMTATVAESPCDMSSAVGVCLAVVFAA
jgi:hypothetical protein